MHKTTRLPRRRCLSYVATRGKGRFEETIAMVCATLSQVIKAALLLAQPDKRLLKAYQEIRGADQRYRQEPEG
jgi:hypothetical protein